MLEVSNNTIGTKNKFKIEQVYSGMWQWQLINDYGQILLVGADFYKSKDACEKHIDIVKYCCVESSNYEFKKIDETNHYFNLKCKSGEEVARAGVFYSIENMKNLIEEVKQVAPTAEIC